MDLCAPTGLQSGYEVNGDITGQCTVERPAQHLIARTALSNTESRFYAMVGTQEGQYSHDVVHLLFYTSDNV